MNLQGISVIDLLLGLQRNDGHSLLTYKTFTPAMQKQLCAFTRGGGRIMVSGAYVGSDMQQPGERAFLADVLKVKFDGVCREPNGQIRGMGTAFSFYRQPNEQHYAAPCTDILMPAVSQAFPTMVYDNNQTSAAVAYQGSDYRAFTMGFPFECISDSNTRQAIMKAIITFLLE
jgi:hypothetical protein